MSVFVRNKTRSYQGFSVDKKIYSLAPNGAKGDTLPLADGDEKSVYVAQLLAQKKLEIVVSKEQVEKVAMEALKATEAKEAEKVLAVDNLRINEKNTKSFVHTQCCANTKAGSQCSKMVNVAEDDYEAAGGIVFCTLHSGEDATEYIKDAEGVVSKKIDAPAIVEEFVAVEPVDEFVAIEESSVVPEVVKEAE